MPRILLDGINRLEEETKDNTGLTFVIAVNYGGRDEIRRAAAKLAEDVKAGKVEAEDITESVFASYLDTADIPDPDLLIRTSGELETVQLSAVAAGIYRTVCYRLSVAGF